MSNPKQSREAQNHILAGRKRQKSEAKDLDGLLRRAEEVGLPVGAEFHTLVTMGAMEGEGEVDAEEVLEDCVSKIDAAIEKVLADISSLMEVEKRLADWKYDGREWLSLILDEIYKQVVKKEKLE